MCIAREICIGYHDVLTWKPVPVAVFNSSAQYWLSLSSVIGQYMPGKDDTLIMGVVVSVDPVC